MKPKKWPNVGPHIFLQLFSSSSSSNNFFLSQFFLQNASWGLCNPVSSLRELAFFLFLQKKSQNAKKKKYFPSGFADHLFVCDKWNGIVQTFNKTYNVFSWEEEAKLDGSILKIMRSEKIKKRYFFCFGCSESKNKVLLQYSECFHSRFYYTNLQIINSCHHGYFY